MKQLTGGADFVDYSVGFFCFIIHFISIFFKASTWVIILGMIILIFVVIFIILIIFSIFGNTASYFNRFFSFITGKKDGT